VKGGTLHEGGHLSEVFEELELLRRRYVREARENLSQQDD
jgi:hypothetical protein